MKKLLKLIVNLAMITGNGVILAWFALPIAKGYLEYYPERFYNSFSFWDFETGERVIQKEMSLFAAAEKADSFPTDLFIILMSVLILFVFLILFNYLETNIFMPAVMIIDVFVGFQIYKDSDISGILYPAFSHELKGLFGDSPEFWLGVDYYEEIVSLPQKVYPWLIAAAFLALTISVCCHLSGIVKSKLKTVITPMGQRENLCQRCGKVNKEESQYCVACGFKIVDFCCPECGAKRGGADQFCMKCGKKFPEINSDVNGGMS